MLISSHIVSVDAKGRVSVPARFREYLSAAFGDQIVLLGKDECIFAYPLEEWRRRFSEKLQGLSTSRKEVRRYLRRIYGRAQPCEFDRQGRILLPARLRESFGIRGEAVIAGIEDRLEIWDPEKWEKEMGSADDGEAAASDEDLIEFEF